MRKVLMTGILCVTMAALATGCTVSTGKADATTETTEASGLQFEADYTKGINTDGTLANINYGDFITLAEYKGIEIKKDDVTASKEDIQSQVDSLMANYETTKEVTDRESKEGDIVNIDYVGSVDGVEFDGGADQGYDLTLGSHTFIDGFEDQLVGHKAGDKVKVEVTFPEDYQSEDLAGKAAVFETTVNSVNEKVIPELNDAFVKENLEATYGYKSVADMKAKIKEGLEDNLMKAAVWDYLVNNSTFEGITDDMINERIDVYIGGLASQLSAYGATLDDYLNMYGYGSVEDLYSIYHDSGEETVKTYLVADAIADKEGLKVDEDALKEYFGTDDYGTYVDTYSENYVNRTVLNYVVEEFCAENAVIK